MGQRQLTADLGPINVEGGAQSGNQEPDGLFAKLNENYHAQAPRIKSIE